MDNKRLGMLKRLLWIISLPVQVVIMAFGSVLLILLYVLNVPASVFEWIRTGDLKKFHLNHWNPPYQCLCDFWDWIDPDKNKEECKS